VCPGGVLIDDSEDGSVELSSSTSAEPYKYPHCDLLANMRHASLLIHNSAKTFVDVSQRSRTRKDVCGWERVVAIRCSR
jgi:hypothetical protein